MKSRFDLHAFLKDIRPVWISALASLALSILLVEFSHTLNFGSGLHRILFIATALAALLLPGILVIAAIRKTFRFESRITLLGTILACYFFVIIVFAGIYYAMSGLGDITDAEHAYDHYTQMRVGLEEGTIPEAYIRDDHRLFFEGIETHLWEAIHDCIPEHVPQTESPEVLEHLLAATKTPFQDCLRFAGENRIYVFLACLHFSIVTMTTLGYGDITPVRTLSRLTADLQILSSVTLFSLGLGMVFGGWLDRQT